MVIGANAIAQPPLPPPPDDRQPQDNPPPLDQGQPGDTREALRERLTRRLENTKRVQQRLEQALKQLDEGAPADRVRGDLQRDARDQMAGEAARRNGMGGANRPPRHAEDVGFGAGRPGPNPPNGGPVREGLPPHPAGRPLDRERLLEMIEKNNPEFASRLRDLQRDNPGAADQMWKRLDPQLRELLVEPDPDIQNVRIAELRNGWATLGKVRELHDAMRKGVAADVEEKTQALRPLFAERYDLQVKLQQADIAKLEKRLQQLREESGRNASDGKDKFVQDRVNEMLARTKERVEREKIRATPPNDAAPAPTKAPASDPHQP
jgi:hypothetical protein